MRRSMDTVLWYGMESINVDGDGGSGMKQLVKVWGSGYSGATWCRYDSCECGTETMVMEYVEIGCIWWCWFRNWGGSGGTDKWIQWHGAPQKQFQWNNTKDDGYGGSYFCVVH